MVVYLLIYDLLWSDPLDDFTNENTDKFVPNTVRGCSFFFSFSAILEFLERNKFLSLIRAHEAQDTGYRIHRKNEKTGFPSVITLFSAPNYLGSYGNKAAILKYENSIINIRQFNPSPHPYHLPGFMNVFDWSLPFLAEKMGDLLATFGKLVDDEFQEAVEEEQRQRFISLRKKVTAVVRITKAIRKVREEREQLVKAGSISPSGISLPSSLSDSPQDTLAKSLNSFERVRSIDLPNEARPPESPVKKLVIPSTDTLKRFLSRDNIIHRKKLRTNSDHSDQENEDDDDYLPDATPLIQEDDSSPRKKED